MKRRYHQPIWHAISSTPLCVVDAANARGGGPESFAT
jgi:hypothetical protein